MPKLLFIDTNIYLDFYRIKNEMRTSFLGQLEAIKDSLIVTDQVEMEFKKNRQVEIRNRINELKPPPNINFPSILKSDKSAIALKNDYKKINNRINKLKIRLKKVIESPSRSDKVYQTLQRLFSKKQDIDLNKKHKKRDDIHSLAYKRFLLGCPPRKYNDTSIGDAINWEWLIYIAGKKNADIWIVSRDGDYGLIQKNKGFLNDWLQQEFKERVSNKKKVVLCPTLTGGLREFEIPVTEEQEKEEERIIENKALSVFSAAFSDSFSLSDNVFITIHRRCELCGTKFEVQGDERICFDCNAKKNI